MEEEERVFNQEKRINENSDAQDSVRDAHEVNELRPSMDQCRGS